MPPLLAKDRSSRAPSITPFRRGGCHEKTPSVPGGVRWVQALPLDQRARPSDTPQREVAVVTGIWPRSPIGGISRAAGAASRRRSLHVDRSGHYLDIEGGEAGA